MEHTCSALTDTLGRGLKDEERAQIQTWAAQVTLRLKVMMPELEGEKDFEAVFAMLKTTALKKDETTYAAIQEKWAELEKVPYLRSRRHTALHGTRSPHENFVPTCRRYTRPRSHVRSSVSTVTDLSFTPGSGRGSALIASPALRNGKRSHAHGKLWP